MKITGPWRKWNFSQTIERKTEFSFENKILVLFVEADRGVDLDAWAGIAVWRNRRPKNFFQREMAKLTWIDQGKLVRFVNDNTKWKSDKMR